MLLLVSLALPGAALDVSIRVDTRMDPPKWAIIRSMQNGSRGPMLRKATALDRVGDPFALVLAMKRYANPPTALHPWHR